MTAAPLFPGFDGLMTLSRREGVDIRPTLLRVLTDLYVQASAHSADEERQFVELTSRLIDQVDDATRAAVRARLAIYPATPAESWTSSGCGVRIPASPCRSRRDCRSACRRAAGEGAADRSPVANGVEPGDAAERCRRNQRHVLRGERERARADPAQSRRDAAEGFGANSRRARRARDPDAGDGGVRRGQRKFCARDRRGPDPAGADRRASRQRSRRRAAGVRGAGAGHAERGLPARADVPRSGIRLLRAQCLPAVAALRPAERTIRPGDAGGVARLDHGGHPRQISLLAVRRRAQSRARGDPQTRPAVQPGSAPAIRTGTDGSKR